MRGYGSMERKEVPLMAFMGQSNMAERGLMKDEFHYCQEGYNLVGEEAGRRYMAK